MYGEYGSVFYSWLSITVYFYFVELQNRVCEQIFTINRTPSWRAVQIHTATSSFKILKIAAFAHFTTNSNHFFFKKCKVYGNPNNVFMILETVNILDENNPKFF